MSFDEISNAIKKGDVLYIRHALESGGVDPNISHRFGASLLIVAAHVGNTAIGRELIMQGAPIDARDDHGWTALCMAVHTGHVGFVQLLLDAGASLDEQAFGGSIESFLEWSLLYGTGTKEAMIKMRPIIQSARSSRIDAANAHNNER